MVDKYLKDAFSCWEYNPNNYTLWYTRKGPGYEYEIDLEKCFTSAELLDWIFQVGMKTWIPLEDLGRLIKCIYYLLNPQRNLCSFGKSKEIKGTRELEQIINHNFNLYES